jgi:uncharacterized protein YndB with AHSA1/START domain
MTFPARTRQHLDDPDRTENRVTTQVHTVYVGASPEAIWNAIVDPEWTSRYGYKCPVSYELHPGGAFHVTASREMAAMGSPEIIIEGEVTEIDAPRMLVQTWRALFDSTTAAEPEGTLTWRIKEENGVSKVTLTHELEGAPVTASLVNGSMPNTGGGWPWMLSDMKTLLETGSALAG